MSSSHSPRQGKSSPRLDDGEPLSPVEVARLRRSQGSLSPMSPGSRLHNGDSFPPPKSSNPQLRLRSSLRSTASTSNPLGSSVALEDSLGIRAGQTVKPGGFFSDPVSDASQHIQPPKAPKISTAIDYSSSVQSPPPVSALDGDHFVGPSPIFSRNTLDQGKISSVEVKVRVPYETPIGEVPRAVVVERKRREYGSYHIYELLRDRGFDYALPGVIGGPRSNPPRVGFGVHSSYLPLEVFDSDVTDPRSPEDWMSVASIDHEGVRCIPCEAVRLHADGTGEWVTGKVIDYVSSDGKFVVLDVQTGEKMYLPRIHVWFKVEDPFLFADRVVQAHETRKLSESFLRYNLYIDSMPMDEIPPISDAQLSRVADLALNCERLRQNRSNLSIHEILQEINMDYGRTMNKLIFDENRFDPSQADVFEPLGLPPRDFKAVVPMNGLIPMPEFDLISQVRTFHFCTFLTSPQIIQSNSLVLDECLHLREHMKLFWTDIRKTMRLDEFEQLQLQSIQQLRNYLREDWVDHIKKSIVSSLKDVGKGWLNLRERNRETYEMSKLKKYMRQIKFLMEDQLRFFTEQALLDYVRYVELQCRLQVRIHSCGNVGIVDPELVEKVDRLGLNMDDYRSPNGSVDNEFRIPMFSLDLMERDGVLTYSTPIERFREVLLGVFQRGLEALRDIPSVEHLVMDNFRFHEISYLEAVRFDEPAIRDLYDRLLAAVDFALSPILEYPSTFSDYEPILQTNPKKFADDFKERENVSLQDYKIEISRQLRIKGEVSASMPDIVNLGLASVDCQNIRNQLTRRTAETAKNILAIVNKLGRDKAKEVVLAFVDVSNKLRVNPRNIEHLSEIKEYIKSVPRTVAQLQGDVREMRSYFDILEQFESPLADDDFKSYWSAVFWPRQVEMLIDTCERSLDDAQVHFKDNMDNEKIQFEKDLDRLATQVSRFSRHTDLSKVEEISAEVKHIKLDLKNAQEQALKFNSREILFGAEKTEYVKLSATAKEFEPYFNLWTNANDWLKWKYSWENDPFEEIDSEDVESKVNTVYGIMYKQGKSFKQGGQVALGEIADTILAQVNDFRPQIPLIMALRNPGMQQRHWEEISSRIGFDVFPGTTIQSLQDVYRLELFKFEDIIGSVSEKAAKEYNLEMALKKMRDDWRPILFDIAEHKKPGTYILRGLDDVWQMLDDHIVKAQAMGFSPYKGPHKEAIEAWEKSLSRISDILDAWTKFQQGWMQNEPIFSSEDIMEQLPVEGKKFKQVNRQWIKWMDQARLQSHILTFCDNNPRVLEVFHECNRSIDEIQKGLNAYLETKRQAFARFYFLSNDELLAILSQTRDPRAVQPHLRKCFENVMKLEFESDNRMVKMFSAEGEAVPFVRGIYPEGNVESWLGSVEKMMRDSVHQQIEMSVEDYAVSDRKDWVLRWPGQVVLVCSQIYWTQLVEEALNSGEKDALQNYLEQLKKQLEGLTEIVSGKLSKLGRVTLGALITIEVHQRDVVDQMCREGVSSVKDFEWASQMRYYWEDSNVHIRQVETHFVYGYEYLGNTMRLVITPLTDRIYLTLTGALHLNLGGAPAGPAGTGKTETVKDLAKALAKQCVVFNCQEGLDYLAMEKFFKGLAMAGAWACFDEFNRIDVEVLSVVAQQMTELVRALSMGLSHIRFGRDNTEIYVDPSFAVFITMNPGYAGRTELPDNLKALFRPVACMVPDYAMIAEIRLFSFGFKDAFRLSRKMVATFRLSSEQLSSQDHYDFGMRAVNTVIGAAGLLKREDPGGNEELILLRALRDSNLPKFLVDDILLFNGIISDLFPGVKQPETDYTHLKGALLSAISHFNLQPVPNFIEKCLQLYEMTVLRHGLMLVGKTGAGKTSAYRCLQYALTELRDLPRFNRVKVFPLNPKSITMDQLYGGTDPMTHEWFDGIVAVLFRKAVSDESPDKKWIVFDGPVDALWIESMNTVLDDNKKLCLVSGETITMSPEMTIMFEVEDLAVASPATVSRCGMVYMEPESCVGMEAQVSSWLNSVPKLVHPYVDQLRSLFSQYLGPSLHFLRRECVEYVPTVENNKTCSVFNILDCFFDEYIEREAVEIPKDVIDALPVSIEPFFMMALIWGAAGSLDRNSRGKFDHFLRSLLAEHGSTLNMPDEADRTIFDYCYSQSDRGFRHWLETTSAFVLDPKLKFSDIIVPTTDTIRYSWLLELLVTHNKHTMVVGPTGTGKTLVIKDKLMNHMPQDIVPLFLAFSAQTSANQTQDILDGKFEKRRKGYYGPMAGTRNVILVDDLNMPARERYGAQPPIELLRQWMDYGGWFERKGDLDWRHIIDIVFVGAMGPPGGGRNVVTNRFLRHFNHISFPEMSDESMKIIFGTILGAFIRNNFDAEVHRVVDPLISVSVAVYNIIVQELLPTPEKTHYTFNLRDIAKVFQGVLMGSPRHIPSIEDVLKLWFHENSRVFRDRLVDDIDRAWFDRLIDRHLQESFSTSLSSLLPSEEAGGRLVFGDFLVPGADDRVYEVVPSMEQLKVVMDEYMDTYNGFHPTKQLHLVLFSDAMEHVSRICRVLRQPGGNALLLGVGGSGRQSLTKLATFMMEYDLFEIEITKNYGISDWRDNLRDLLRWTGVDGKNYVFLFSDTSIVHDSFLEDINNILNTGEVPNLFDSADVDVINAEMRKILAEEGMQNVTKIALMDCFTRRVRSHLHLVLAFSPIGEAFRNRLRMFPSLVNCCTIDWFSTWPEEALHSVALAQLNDIRDECGNLEWVSETCVFIHQSVERISVKFLGELRRHNYVTPTSYLELLGTFKRLLGEKRKSLSQQKKRFTSGLEKLISTEKDVNVLKNTLEEMQPKLIVAQEEVKVLKAKIEEDSRQAEETRQVVIEEEAIATAKKNECEGMRNEAADELAVALPALERALDSLKLLQKKDIDEVGAYTVPPKMVKTTMEAVCIMMHAPPKMVGEAGKKKVADYWDSAKQLLKNAQKLKDDMIHYDKNSIDENLIGKIRPYYEDEEFTPENVARSSKACTAMCAFVRAMYDYYHVNRKIEPLRESLSSAEAELRVTEEGLAKTKARLAEVEETLVSLNIQFEETVERENQLKIEVEACERKLISAEQLIGGLGGEKVRWGLSVDELSKSEVNILGDVLKASGAVAYLGPFTAPYRTSLLREWESELSRIGILHSAGISVESILGDPVKIREWQLSGLPSDSLSIENAIIMSKARRWPLMIDPQNQANEWIKKMEEGKLEVIKLTDSDYLRTLENAVQFGRPVLLENVGETIDPALEPILQKQIYKRGQSLVTKIGDAEIPYNDDFRFYITTKYRNPHYSPEISVKVTLLNFFITPEGLEDQLLGVLVQKEKPELQRMKSALVVENAESRNKLAELEDLILKLLEEAGDEILDRADIVRTLQESKITSSEISKKMEESVKTEAAIDETRNSYRPVAFKASLMFFTISDLAGVDPMYQYSLQWYINLFVAAIEQAEQSDDLHERLTNLHEFFTRLLYENVCRSLFEKHKLLFAFLLSIRLLQGEGKVDLSEFRFFLTGGSSIGSKDNPASDWLTTKSWREIQGLAELEAFKGIDDYLISHSQEFRALYDSNNCHRDRFPGQWGDSLSPLQRLLLIRCMRPDKVVEGISDFVASTLGPRFIDHPGFDLRASYKDSSAIAPLIFVLSAGADPLADLFDFADEMRFSKKLDTISLGQDQGPIAERMIASGSEHGTWILLQNCHLATSWMPDLERICEGLKEGNVHPNFRLWLTSMPNEKFPVSVLQNGVKMTNEPPKGLRANLRSTFSRFTDKVLEHPKQQDQFCKLLLGLSIFHAVIQERRKFGPLGWNIRYEFTSGDLMCCVTQLRQLLEQYVEIPYKVIKTLTGLINYGGRVTDSWDSRTLMTLLEDYINPNVLETGYQFTVAPEYHTIDAITQNEFMEYINELPLRAEPEVFGLHANADITCANAETYEMLDTILELQPRSSSSGGKSSEEVIEEVAAHIYEQLPPIFDIEEITTQYPTSYNESMNTVLQQEAIRYNKVLRIMHSTLPVLRKALKGLVVMSEQLEKIAISLFNNHVPHSWADEAYPSLMPLSSWYKDFLARISFVQNWFEKGTPSVFWISGFYFPQAFLTGTLQNYARKKQISIDTVSFSFVVVDKNWKDITEKPEDGCYIYGLFLEGARWDHDRGSLTESRPKELYTEMPVIWLRPEVNKAGQTPNTYKCPVYKTLTRAGTLSTTGHSTNYVLTIELSSAVPEEHWIKRGVALFCALDFC